MTTVLSIAGTDPSGGAGIQADLKTFAAHGCYGMCVITALVAQNTMGVRAVEPASAGMVCAQMDCVFEDIFPDAVKIGMLASYDIASTVADGLEAWNARRVVVDPVMVSSSGRRLLSEDAVAVLTGRILPRASLVTPNIPEAEALCSIAISCRADMERAARTLQRQLGCAVLVKGGHAAAGADDVLCDGDTLQWFCGERVVNDNTHGTGCTLSSAIACSLAQGYTLVESVEAAKRYLTGALRAGLNLGQGNGPLDHLYAAQKKVLL